MLMFSAALLLGLDLISEVFTDNENYYDDSIFIVLGHVFTYGTVGVFMVNIFKKYAAEWMFYILAIVQMLWRQLSVSFGHIDCGYSCSSEVLPLSIDGKLTLVVVVVLMIMSVYFAYRLQPRSR